MKYYSLLNFTKEPFSNSPDPEMFFKSSQHQGCVQKLEIALHLRRGLSVVIGDIGTGKSTICRQLLRQIHNNDKILAYLLLDPEFNSADEFLSTIAKIFSINDTENKSTWQIKDSIKDYLFEQAAKLDKIPVLIIDEGQKLPLFCIEILREFLNYETNQHKLLQIIIFAQEEFNDILRDKANFADRVTSRYHLTPLNFKDTREMISFRLKKSHRQPESPPRLFSPLATLTIYLISGGYPRKIVMLCSKLIIALLVRNKKEAGLLEVFSCLKETGNFAYGKIIKFSAALLLACTILVFFATNALKSEPTVIAERPSASTQVSARGTQQKLPEVPAVRSKPPIPRIEKKKITRLDLVEFTRLPNILGQLPIERNTTLSKMVARVYGRYTKARLRMVMNANPKIGSSNKLRPGDVVKFPREEKNTFQPKPAEFWLELGHENNLTSAYNIIKNFPEDAPPIIIVPTLRLNDPVFLLVVEKLFPQRATAENILKKLPPELQIKAKIRQG